MDDSTKHRLYCNTIKFALWVCLFGLLLIAAASVPAKSGSRLQCVAVAFVAWAIILIFGKVEISALPLKKWTQYVEGWFQRGRVYRRAILCLSLPLIVAIDLHIGICLWKRDVYERAIHSALSTSQSQFDSRLRFLVDAFCTIPERVDAHALIGDLFLSQRSTGQRPHHRKFVRRFTLDPRVLMVVSKLRQPKSKVMNALSFFGSPITPKERSRVIGDPLLWYLSILPEGSVDDESTLLRLSLEMMPKDRTSYEQTILEKTLEIELPENRTNDVFRKMAKIDFERIVDELANQGSVDPVYWEVLLDRLATWHMTEKLLSAEDQTKAIKYVDQLVNFRRERNARKVAEPILLPPEKLMTYWLFVASQSSSNDNMPLPARRILNSVGTNMATMLKAEVFDRYGFEQRAEWLKGTFADPDLKESITGFLNEGWRF